MPFIKAHTIAQKTRIFVLLTLLLSVGQAFAQPNENAAENTGEENTTGETEQEAPAVSPTPAPRKKIDLEKQKISLLSQELKDGDLTWLDSEGEKFMGLWIDDKTGNPFGALLILHGEGQTAAWQLTVDSIRKDLVHHGWATLAISLPPQKKPKVPKRPMPTPTPAPESAEEPTGEEGDPDDLAEKIEEKIPGPATSNDAEQDTQESSEPEKDPALESQSRLKAAFSFLNQKGHYNIVVIGQGSGAIRAAQFLDKQSNGKAKIDGAKIQRPARALVLVEARNRIETEADKALSDFINDPKLPILDIYFGGHFLDDMETKERKVHARATNIEHFYQLKMVAPQASDVSTENRLTRRIRGFLNKHAKGVEIERK